MIRVSLIFKGFILKKIPANYYILQKHLTAKFTQVTKNYNQTDLFMP